MLFGTMNHPIRFNKNSLYEFLNHNFSYSKLITFQLVDLNRQVELIRADNLGNQRIYMNTLVTVWEFLGRDFVIKTQQRFALKFDYTQDPQKQNYGWIPNLRISYHNDGANAIVNEFVKNC